MRRYNCVRDRVVLLLLVLVCALQWACATIVQGGIPPSAFDFRNVVPISQKDPSGWKVAKVKILLGRLSSAFSAAAFCDIEVGIPEINFRGPIPDEFAQLEAAAAADAAARIVLSQGIPPTAILCRSFQEEMERILSAAIPGVRVTKFLTPNVPHKTFP
jgi:hypothetical protein